MSSAMIEEPPSPSKQALICRFLEASGIQHAIDSGTFVQRLALPGGPLVGSGLNFGANLEAVARAYAKHRAVWQDEYERHANWEFTEEELRGIVGFLESDIGKHFLEGRWRMDAYVATNTEHLLEDIVADAQASLDERAV